MTASARVLELFQVVTELLPDPTRNLPLPGKRIAPLRTRLPDLTPNPSLTIKGSTFKKKASLRIALLGKRPPRPHPEPLSYRKKDRPFGKKASQSPPRTPLLRERAILSQKKAPPSKKARPRRHPFVVTVCTYTSLTQPSITTSPPSASTSAPCSASLRIADGPTMAERENSCSLHRCVERLSFPTKLA